MASPANTRGASRAWSTPKPGCFTRRPSPRRPPRNRSTKTNCSQGQRADWTLLRSPAAASNDLAAAIAAGERFLAQTPARTFCGRGLLPPGFALAQQGEPATAREFLQQAAGQYPGAVGETGYPLKTWAQVQLLKLADSQGSKAGPMEELVNALCAQVVVTPSPLSPLLWGRIAARETNRPSLAGWLRVVRAHDQARALQSQVTAAAAAIATNGVMTFRARWLRLTPANDWLVTWHPAGTNYWLVALPQEQARQIVNETLGRMALPAYLGVSVELAGRGLGPDAPAGDVLADGSASLSSDGGAPTCG